MWSWVSESAGRSRLSPWAVFSLCWATPARPQSIDASQLHKCIYKSARLCACTCVCVCFSCLLINVEMSTCALKHLVLGHVQELRLAFRSYHLQAGRGHTLTLTNMQLYTHINSFFQLLRESQWADGSISFQTSFLFPAEALRHVQSLATLVSYLLIDHLVQQREFPSTLESKLKDIGEAS